MAGDDGPDQTCAGNAAVSSSENQDSVIAADASASTDVPMSNKQRKKLLKRQKWLEQKPLRKAKEREKRKLKIKQAREEGRDLGPTRKFLKSQKMADSPCKLRICFDLSLAEVMTEPEFSKTFKQLHRCYSINRRSAAPLQLYIAGYTDATKEKMANKSDCFNWDVNFNPLTYREIFPKEDLIYLTSESPNTMEELDYSKTYVIGALVDHNRLKDFCHQKAQEVGIAHAKLPLDNYFKFKTRKVLTICEVYMIFLQLTEGRPWVEAVQSTIPKRKGIEPLTDTAESELHSDCEDDPCEKSTESDAKEGDSAEEDVS